MGATRCVRKGPVRRSQLEKRQRLMELRERGWSVIAVAREIGPFPGLRPELPAGLPVLDLRTRAVVLPKTSWGRIVLERRSRAP
jgi:hypothetical protein